MNLEIVRNALELARNLVLNSLYDIEYFERDNKFFGDSDEVTEEQVLDFAKKLSDECSQCQVFLLLNEALEELDKD